MKWASKWNEKTVKQGIIAISIFLTTCNHQDYATVYIHDLAGYAAVAATSVPTSELNISVDVGWSWLLNDKKLVAAFSKVLNKPMKAKPVISSFIFKVIELVVALFSDNMKDMYEMIKCVDTGEYVSKNTEVQKQLFSDFRLFKKE